MLDSLAVGAFQPSEFTGRFRNGQIPSQFKPSTRNHVGFTHPHPPTNTKQIKHHFSQSPLCAVLKEAF